MIWLLVFLMLPLVPLILLDIAREIVESLMEAFNLD
jgi:hypothetical protein